MLQAENLCIKYEGRVVLDNVSITLNIGEVTVLLGPSGSGKTTLLRCLCMLDIPDSGIVRIENRIFNFDSKIKNVKSLNISSVYPLINIVFQQFFLWNHMTNRENIEFPLRENGVSSNEIKKTIERLAKDLDLDAFIDKFPHQSSVGQKQRIAIARTVALRPKYLLLDEITSALDIIQTSNIIKVVKSLAEKQRIAILFVTHNLDVAKRIADKIVFIDSGKVIETGNKDIFSNPSTHAFKSFIG